MSQKVAGACLSRHPYIPRTGIQTQEPCVSLTSPRSTAPSCQTSLCGCPLTADGKSTSPATPTPSSFVSSGFFLLSALVLLRKLGSDHLLLYGQSYHWNWPPCHTHFLRVWRRPEMQAAGPGDQHQPISTLLTPHSPPFLQNNHPLRLALGASTWRAQELPLPQELVRLPSLGTPEAPSQGDLRGGAALEL